MRKMLCILEQLTDQDADWLGRGGRRLRVPPGSEIIRQNQPVEAMFIVLDGTFEVQVEGVGTVARLGAGEIVGEMSFIEDAPASAAVVAAADSAVLALAKADVAREIERNPRFGVRFYKALAALLSDRLRAMLRPRGAEAPAPGLDPFEEMPEAGRRYRRMLRSVEVGHGEALGAAV